MTAEDAEIVPVVAEDAVGAAAAEDAVVAALPAELQVVAGAAVDLDIVAFFTVRPHVGRGERHPWQGKASAAVSRLGKARRGRTAARGRPDPHPLARDARSSCIDLGCIDDRRGLAYRA